MTTSVDSHTAPTSADPVAQAVEEYVDSWQAECNCPEFCERDHEQD
jgi:hypothetical protein